MNCDLELIDGDIYNVCGRLKEIDAGYEVYRNRRTLRYEIFKDGAPAFAAPFPMLDARTVEYARKTRVENVDRIICEIERENAETERKAAVRAREKAEEIYDC